MVKCCINPFFYYKVSAVVGRRTLVLMNINDVDNPVELAFQPSYGSISTYRWFGDGYILIGFSGGYSAYLTFQ